MIIRKTNNLYYPNIQKLALWLFKYLINDIIASMVLNAGYTVSLALALSSDHNSMSKAVAIFVRKTMKKVLFWFGISFLLWNSWSEE